VWIPVRVAQRLLQQLHFLADFAQRLAITLKRNPAIAEVDHPAHQSWREFAAEPDRDVVSAGWPGLAPHVVELHAG